MFQVGRVAAAFEFIQRAAGGLVVVEFDEPGGFGEAAEGLLLLLALQVDGDDGAHDEQQAHDPRRGKEQVASVEAHPRGLTEGAGFAEQAFRQSLGVRCRAFDPSAEAHDEDRRRRTAGGFLAEHVPFLEQAFEGRAEAGLGLGGRGEFAGPRFEFGHLREQFP